MLYDRVEIEAIKVAVGNLDVLGVSSKQVLIQSIVWLRENYEINGEEKYLVKAIWHIYAYLGLGFPYEDGEKEFYEILRYIDKTREELFPVQKWRHNRIKLNKTNIRNLLGNWNPVLHSMKINDVVNDILRKVINRESGKYLYHSGKVIASNGEKQLWENTYKLYINDEEVFFHDVNRNKYYVFARKDE